MDQERFGGDVGVGTMTRTVETIESAVEHLGAEFRATDAAWVSDVRDHLNAAAALIRQNTPGTDAG